VKIVTLICLLILCYSFAYAKTASKTSQCKGKSYSKIVEGDYLSLYAIGNTSTAYSLAVNNTSTDRYISGISVAEYRYSTQINYKGTAGIVAANSSISTGSISRSPDYTCLHYVHKVSAKTYQYAQDSLDNLTYTALQETN
jgi:hypothetical protein